MAYGLDTPEQEQDLANYAGFTFSLILNDFSPLVGKEASLLCAALCIAKGEHDLEEFVEKLRTMTPKAKNLWASGTVEKMVAENEARALAETIARRSRKKKRK